MEVRHESFIERAKVYSQLIARPRAEPKKVKTKSVLLIKLK
jgi:hypothetical protein